MLRANKSDFFIAVIFSIVTTFFLAYFQYFFVVWYLAACLLFCIGFCWFLADRKQLPGSHKDVINIKENIWYKNQSKLIAGYIVFLAILSVFMGIIVGRSIYYTFLPISVIFALFALFALILFALVFLRALWRG